MDEEEDRTEEVTVVEDLIPLKEGAFHNSLVKELIRVVVSPLTINDPLAKSVESMVILLTSVTSVFMKRLLFKTPLHRLML